MRVCNQVKAYRKTESAEELFSGTRKVHKKPAQGAEDWSESTGNVATESTKQVQKYNYKNQPK